jgi:hypothetical protein
VDLQRHTSRTPRPRHRNKTDRAFWFEFGRLLFPELINHPKTMKTRMMIITVGLVAILVGALVGFYHHANDPADILLIQARELHK